MTNLKKTLFATLAVATATAAIAGPAAAQGYGYDRGYDRSYDHGRYEQNRWNDGDNINARQAQIERRIEWGARRGQLDRREVEGLRAEARDIARIEARARYDGLSWQDRRELDRRLDRLEARLDRESHDRDYGYGYGYDRYGR